MSEWARLDLRSLAIFRVALGGVLAIDLLSRVLHITEFYTDDGVLPRILLGRSEFIDDWLCFHLGVGHWLGIFCLLMLQIALALGLALGWRTKLMTLGSWLLLNSLHVRNPFVNDRGDHELVLLLFWSFFLPLGARWSLDSRAGRTDWGSNTGLPAAAFVLQIAQIYLFAGFFKYGDFWLARGDGFYHSLKSPLFATAFAGWLATAPMILLKLTNYAVIVGEIFAGLLLLSPYTVLRTRSVALVLLTLFHLSVLALFRLGLFPLVGLVGLLPLLPPLVWQAGPLARRQPPPEESRESNHEALPRWAKCAIGLCIFLTLLSNAAFRPDGPAFERPAPLVGLTRALVLEQHWELFSPLPPYNGYFEIAYTHRPSDTVRIPTEASFPSHRWKMLMISSLYPQFSVVRPGILNYLADSPEHARYRFRVRLVGPDGKSKQYTTWVLWDGQASGS